MNSMNNAPAPLNYILLCLGIATALSACTSDSNLDAGTNQDVVTNTAPVADDQNLVIDEDIATAITLTGSDADNDTLSYTVSSPANGSIKRHRCRYYLHTECELLRR